MSWRDVLAQYSNRYDETVHVTAVNKQGERQTITSNRIHPYFARITASAVLATASITMAPSIASEGYTYMGDILGGVWVDAQHLKPGDELLGANSQWQSVEAVVVEDRPLDAYNISVDEYATYFVAEHESAVAVWVHNTCADRLPDGYRWTGDHTNFGQPRFIDSDGTVWYRGHDGRFYNEVDHPPTQNWVDGPRPAPSAYDNQFPADPNAGLAGPVAPQTTGNNATGQNLATNMRRVGFTQPPNSTAHHIVSSNHRNAEEARRLIGEIDPPFDVNEAANGVFLPTNSNNPDYTAPQSRKSKFR